jgi:putrescine aminotransferase
LVSAHTIRIEPPLVITYEQIDTVLDRLEDTINEVGKSL